VRIIETCEYEVEASDGDAAERLFLRHGPSDERRGVRFVGVTERHVIEQRELAAAVSLQRYREQFGGAL